MARDELQRILPDARAGRLRGVRLYVFRLDRLTRTGIADTLSTPDELRTHGVDVVSVADGFDLNGPHAEVIIAVMAWAAKMERLRRASRSQRRANASRPRAGAGAAQRGWLDPTSSAPARYARRVGRFVRSPSPSGSRARR
jgi:DNA invertase Pin-like site-specific DNA recombinase